jgi:putative restriction endonuclease
MKIWVGVTDSAWFEMLRALAPDEVNFWQPSGDRDFRALAEGEPFLFKLHSPRNFIAGGGFFVRYSALPTSLAWSAFGEKNGVRDHGALLARIRKYRKGDSGPDPYIGCNVLAEPFFWPEPDWIPVGGDWAKNIVRGRTYDTAEPLGAELWHQVLARLSPAMHDGIQDRASEDLARYGKDYLQRSRLGQGAFRVLVTDAYQRRCTITGERTLPVLEAAHIKAFSENGPNRIDNGLLFRSDIHRLFDQHYITITPELRVEVSRYIKEEWENGRDYYALHGKPLRVLPEQAAHRPSIDFLSWHNERFRG